MILDYIYHSGFAIEAEGVTLSLIITRTLRKRNEIKVSYTTVCSNDPASCMYLPHIFIPTILTGKY